MYTVTLLPYISKCHKAVDNVVMLSKTTKLFSSSCSLCCSFKPIKVL